MNKFYNSIKLLGEYYNKARVLNETPIRILSTSLLNLLNNEIEKEFSDICHLKNDDFSDLLLGQVRQENYFSLNVKDKVRTLLIFTTAYH